MPKPNRAQEETVSRGEIAEIFRRAALDFYPSNIDDIEDIFAEYHQSIMAGPASIAGDRRTAQHLKKQLAKVEASLKDLSRNSISIIRSIYRSDFTGQKLHTDIASLERIRDVVDVLLESMPRGGRPSTEARDELFFALAQLFEGTSGEEFRYPDKRRRFRGSNFVRCIAQLADGKFSPVDQKAGLEAADERIKMQRNLGKT